MKRNIGKEAFTISKFYKTKNQFQKTLILISQVISVFSLSLVSSTVFLTVSKLTSLMNKSEVLFTYLRHTYKSLTKELRVSERVSVVEVLMP